MGRLRLTQAQHWPSACVAHGLGSLHRAQPGQGRQGTARPPSWRGVTSEDRPDTARGNRNPEHVNDSPSLLLVFPFCARKSTYLRDTAPVVCSPRMRFAASTSSAYLTLPHAGSDCCTSLAPKPASGLSWPSSAPPAAPRAPLSISASLHRIPSRVLVHTYLRCTHAWDIPAALVHAHLCTWHWMDRQEHPFFASTDTETLVRQRELCACCAQHTKWSRHLQVHPPTTDAIKEISVRLGRPFQLAPKYFALGTSRLGPPGTLGLTSPAGVHAADHGI